MKNLGQKLATLLLSSLIALGTVCVNGMAEEKKEAEVQEAWEMTEELAIDDLAVHIHDLPVKR